MDTLITAKEVIARHSEHEPTKPLTLEISAGSITCLVGSAGAGKTLFLKTLAGIIPPQGGRLTIMGQEAATLDRKTWLLLRTKIAYVSGNTPLISFYNGWRNVIFPALYHGIASQDDVEKKAERLLEKIGIQGDISVLPAYLNRVQTYKLTVVRSLMLDPVVLFLDEPFRQFDVLNRAQLKSFFLDLVRDSGISLVIATHDIAFSIKHANTLAYLAPGGNYLFQPGSDITASRSPDVQNFLATLENGWQP